MEEKKKRTTTKRSKKPVEAPIENEIQEAPAAPIISVRVKTKQGGPLNIRKDANKNSKQLGQIPNGSDISVEAEKISGWYKLADRDGYITGDLVETV